MVVRQTCAIGGPRRRVRSRALRLPRSPERTSRSAAAKLRDEPRVCRWHHAGRVCIELGLLTHERLPRARQRRRRRALLIEQVIVVGHAGLAAIAGWLEEYMNEV